METAHPLRSYLEGHQITVAAFAAKVGVNRVTVHRWLSGVRSPDLSKLVVIQRATHGEVTANDFLPAAAAAAARRARS